MSDASQATAPAVPRRPSFEAGNTLGWLLVAPALSIVALFFALPLGLSVVGAFQDRDGSATLANVAKAYELYSTDFLFRIRAEEIPEPGSIALLGAGLLGLAGIRRRQQKNKA